MTVTISGLTCETHTGTVGRGKNPAPAYCQACVHCAASHCMTPWMQWNDNAMAHIDCQIKAEKAARAAGLTSLHFQEGAQYRVLVPGARLEGFLLHGEELISGWSRPLTVGEILTCKGWQVLDIGPLSEPVRGVQWTGAKIPPSAVSIQVWPFDGLFRPFPMTGVLGPYVEDSGEDLEALVATIEEGHEVDLTGYLADTSSLVEVDDDEVVDLSGY